MMHKHMCMDCICQHVLPSKLTACSHLSGEGHMAVLGLFFSKQRSGLPQLGEKWGTWEIGSCLHLLSILSIHKDILTSL